MHVAVATVQVHPVPAIAVAVIPEGNVSATVTRPDVAVLPSFFIPEMVYVTPVLP